MSSNDQSGVTEAACIGSGFGAFLGGMVLGAGADFLQLPIHSMAAYATGAVLGAIAGYVAGRVAASFILS